MSRTGHLSCRNANTAGHAALGVTVSPTKPSSGMSRIFGTTERSSGYSSADIDPRTTIELALVHRLASLLWRLRRASAIETGLFEMPGEFLLARRQSSAREQPGAVQTAARLNGHGKMPRSNGS